MEHIPLQWRHNEHGGVRYHQYHDYLLNRIFRRRSKKTSKLRVTGLCEGNSPVTGEFPAQGASNAEKVSIWWRHHAKNSGARFNIKTLSLSRYGISVIKIVREWNRLIFTLVFPMLVRRGLYIDTTPCIRFIVCWVLLYHRSISETPLKRGLTFLSAWISNHIPSKVWNEIIYPFPRFNGAVVEVWEWINNFIPNFIRDVLFTYAGSQVNPCSKRVHVLFTMFSEYANNFARGFGFDVLLTHI